MKKLLIATALVAGVGPVAGTAAYAAGDTVQMAPVTIVASCFRGPLKHVIWDRPNPEFIDSLVGYGYSYEAAFAIAERVCRDQTGVGRPGHMVEATTRAIREEPPVGAAHHK